MRAAFFIFCAKSRGAPRQIFRQNVRRNSDIYYRDSFNLPMQIPNQGSVSPNGVRTMVNLLIFLAKGANSKSLASLLQKPPKDSGNVALRIPNIRNRNPIFRIRNRKESALGATYRKELCFRLEPDRKKRGTPRQNTKAPPHSRKGSSGKMYPKND